MKADSNLFGTKPGLTVPSIIHSRFWTYSVSPDLAVENGRADFFVSSWDPTVRNSLQAVILGNFFGLNAYSF